MGIVVYGPCEICHRSSVLAFEERYCSEACQARAKIKQALKQSPLTFRQKPPTDRIGLVFCLLVIALGIALILYLWGQIPVLEKP